MQSTLKWKVTYAIITVTLALFCTLDVSQAKNTNYISNRKPLIQNSYIKLPVGAIEARGWLQTQLELSAEHMTGNLDNLWEDVGQNNGWLGGTGDSWERGPYWLDGLVPLAYTLENDTLIHKAKQWIEWTLSSQSADGFFGPRPDTAKMGEDASKSVNRREAVKRDWWPRMIMLKVLKQYYEATGDQRVIDFMTGYFRYQLKHLPDQPLNHWTHWAKSRGGENFQMVFWLYNHTGDKFLLELGELLYQQTRDWTGRLIGDDPGHWHVVNTAMGVKYPAVYYQYSGEETHKNASEHGIDQLMKHHGQVEGIWSGDELLHGTSPTQGTELCAVVEYAYSLETLLKVTGDLSYAERLEKLVFNALPAQLEPDFTGRQYYQMPNQISITDYTLNFSTRHWGCNLFGFESGYGCCTANYHQGWPKFTSHLWLATQDNGLASLVYAPSRVTARVADGREVTIIEETGYPFHDEVTYRFRSSGTVRFPLHLRIPGWCDDASIHINGALHSTPKPDTLVRIDREWRTGDILTLRLPREVRLSRWHDRAVGVEYGPLVFALNLQTSPGQIEDKHHNFTGAYATYEYHTEDPWNYGISRDAVRNPDKGFTVGVMDSIPAQPWSPDSAPISLAVKGHHIPGWKAYNGIAGPIPWSAVPVDTEAEEIALIPYGSTILRISEFPVAR